MSKVYLQNHSFQVKIRTFQRGNNSYKGLGLLKFRLLIYKKIGSFNLQKLLLGLKLILTMTLEIWHIHYC